MIWEKSLIDISPIVGAKTAVFPGDQRFEKRDVMTWEGGHHLALSSILTTVHIGAHADAPSHYAPQGRNVESLSLTPYFGLCQVVQFPHLKPLLTEDDFKNVPLRAQRILIATQSFNDPNVWKEDFTAVSEGLVHFLADQGVILIGVDTPSLDPAQSKSMRAHKAVALREMAILEGLVLRDVQAGIYGLIALPLRLEGCEASPVRAVLVETP